MEKTKNILVIQNPVSGPRGLDYVQQVVDELRRLGAGVKVYMTKAANDATKHLATLKEDYDLIVIAGGDGTINEAINGLQDNLTPIGLIPAGTTNVLAKEVRMPTTANKVAEVLMKGKLKDVYLARLNGRRFALFAGCGFDAWVVRDVNLDIKKRFGKLAYILSMISSVRFYGSKKFDLVIDGKNYQALSVIMVNGKLYGGQFTVCESGDLSKPELQVIMISAPSRFRFITYLLALPFGISASHKHLVSISGKQIKITVEGEESMQIDGDFGTQLPAEISVESIPIKLVTP